MNRRSYVVLTGTLLTTGCTGTGSSGSPTTSSTDSTDTETETTQTQSSTEESVKAVSIGSESDLPKDINDRTIQVSKSDSPATIIVTKPDDNGFEKQYEAPAGTDFKLDIYVVDDYRVTVKTSGNRSKTVEVTEESFTCVSSVTHITLHSGAIHVAEQEPNASCESGTSTTTTASE
ncbi:hypothetical protein SAMN04487948_11116 [Halogranum amylolyticum]|uniref:Uncharacterized protein n=1 Tax=Halogranum amylolyticum TaxID=660520 RepID=A0A1H8UGT2_9EURY|nr:hypothetical protein SAMN04487948_11116 [Halogranum amylolyticum]